jgi:hypothetical protein
VRRSYLLRLYVELLAWMEPILYFIQNVDQSGAMTLQKASHNVGGLELHGNVLYSVTHPNVGYVSPPTWSIRASVFKIPTTVVGVTGGIESRILDDGQKYNEND